MHRERLVGHRANPIAKTPVFIERRPERSVLSVMGTLRGGLGVGGDGWTFI